ncbi:uncharacterized protein LOC113236250 [Hyposmocoma kahamanoa]|uniref:uncharacterized protein LOC113236250 n=1 Tax=Hyposmocoma kahamanoa TaxID=1477025 RepID=UPI000E6D98D8|nr:uncharacterized protein LOC113236250 [Hyposmocoma kahamanoa]
MPDSDTHTGQACGGGARLRAVHCGGSTPGTTLISRADWDVDVRRQSAGRGAHQSVCAAGSGGCDVTAEGTGTAEKSLSVSTDAGCPNSSREGTTDPEGLGPHPTTIGNRTKDIDLEETESSCSEELPEKLPQGGAAPIGREKAGACQPRDKLGRFVRQTKAVSKRTDLEMEQDNIDDVDPVAKVSQTNFERVSARSKRHLVCEETEPVTAPKISTARRGRVTGPSGASTTRTPGPTTLSFPKPADEETRRLRADNKRMAGELAALKAEVAALRRAFSERPKAPSRGIPSSADQPAGLTELMEELKRSLLVSLGEIINIRLGEIERRLPPEPILRPPLAADKKRAEASRQAPGPSAEASPAFRPPAQSITAAKPAAKRRQRKRQATAAHTEAQSRETAQAASVSLRSTEWTDVVRRKPSKRKRPAQPAATDPVTPRVRTTAPKVKKMTTPKSTAVVITLTPEAAERNVSYKDALKRATAGLQLSTVGLNSVRVRNTATGARIIEVPGSDSGTNADALAEKLREIIGDVAVISRPTPKADIIVSGLDESVGPEDVQRAVAAKSGCTLQLVRVGGIRTRPDGTGSTLVQCPVVAAKTLVEAGRLLVGWSSAHVRAQDPLPMRCFRCMGTGHTRALCPSQVDRSTLCFRCGTEGHRSATCTAEPRCAVCTHARRPAGHVMGGRACIPPPTRGKPAIQVRTANEGQMET